jgi:glycosyltransferase involved in cell wall biosynthesis
LNQPARQSLRKFGYQGKIYIIPNGRNLARYEDCDRPNIESEEKVLSFVGFISERKNQSYLLEVMIHLPATYQLRLIGGALTPGYERQLKRFRERHNLDNVHFLGKIPHEEIPSKLAETHVFVSASTMEVQSLVIIEALASGTPVVGLTNETVEELVDDDVGCRLPRDAPPKEFARCVEEICSLSPKEYATLCEQARTRVQDLDWSNVVEETVAAYQELLQQKRAARERQLERDRLSQLIASLPEGEFKDILVEQTQERRKRRGLWARIKRVPGSTWLLTGATILASLVGYLFMKGKGRGPEDAS